MNKLTYLFHFHVFFNSSFERNKVVSSIDQLIKMKMYTTVFSIIHCIRQQQKHTSNKLLGVSMEDMYIHKILKSAMHQKDPQFHCKTAFINHSFNSTTILKTILACFSASANTKITFRFISFVENTERRTEKWTR